MSWFDDKELSSGVDAIGWNSLKKNVKRFILLCTLRVLISGVDSVPYQLVRPEFFLSEPKPVQKHICFVPIKIPVISGYFSLTGANTVFWPKNLYQSGTEKSRLSDLRKGEKKKKGFAYRSNIPKAVTFWFSFPAVGSTLLMVIPFSRAPFFFFPIRPYQMSFSSVLFHLPFQILFTCLFSFYVLSLLTQG